jgi:RimJ/RimL family protein N-acetyltransferase
MAGAAAGGPKVELKPATQADSEELIRWRNDKATREASVQQGEVSLADHVAWLEKTLVSKDRLLFVGWLEGQRLGQVRLDRRDAGAWEVSITVAPEHRGRGLATAMLRAGEAAAKKAGATLLTARIRSANTASLKAFKRAGYYNFIERTGDAGQVLQCERRVAPYA